MSGEAGPQPAVAAARQFVRAQQHHEIILVGQTQQLRQLLSHPAPPAPAAPSAAANLRPDPSDSGGAENSDPADPASFGIVPSGIPRISICDAAGVVRMDEPPAGAIRRRDSSMRRALELVAQNRADAVVSAGNTGALLGLGVLVLRLVVGAARPAIASFVPNLRKPGDFSCMLDLGANVECDAEMLRQFAVMGAALARAAKGVETPAVKLLNIGEEQFKGRDELKGAAAKLEGESGMRFAGNMEGYDIYRGEADVIVCDGFTGNVALKVSEGLAAMLSRKIRRAFRENPLAVACGIAAWPVLKKLREEMDHRKYNGAFLLGLRGVVVKSHGNADAEAFAAAIQFAAQTRSQDIVGAIARALESFENESVSETETKPKTESVSKTDSDSVRSAAANREGVGKGEGSGPGGGGGG